MHSDHYLHPEFGCLSPTPRLRRELRTAFFSVLFGIGNLRDASQAFATSLFAVMQAVAPSLGVEVIPVNMRNASEIEQPVGTFARSPNGGLIPVASAAAVWTAPSRSAFAATDEYGRFAMPSAWR